MVQPLLNKIRELKSSRVFHLIYTIPIREPDSGIVVVVMYVIGGQRASAMKSSCFLSPLVFVLLTVQFGPSRTTYVVLFLYRYSAVMEMFRQWKYVHQLLFRHLPEKRKEKSC